MTSENNFNRLTGQIVNQWQYKCAHRSLYLARTLYFLWRAVLAERSEVPRFRFELKLPSVAKPHQRKRNTIVLVKC